MSRLPPFFALRALEAAARHRSYSRAGDELAVTHGAVSQQIRRLEAELGARLFERRANSMLPTPDAQRLAREVRRSLDVLYRAVAEFAQAGERDPLVISVEPQFASRWLAARLPRLLAAPAGANLEMRVDERCADLTTDGVDVALRHGGGDWAEVEVERVLPEVLFPVCSPTVAAGRRWRAPGDLAAAPLLHLSHRPWSLWFEAHGQEIPQPVGLVFDDSTMLYEAAAQGLGVALARRGLVDRELESGRLVAALPGEVATEHGYFLVWRAESRKLKRIHALRDWLTAEADCAAAPDTSRAA